MRKKILILGIVFVLLSLALVIGYRVLFLKMIRVPTGAMANTIIPGDQLMVKKLFGEIKRGDIIVFRYPNQPSVQYIARVIGLPRETVEIRDRSVYVDGNELPERSVTVKPVHDSDFGMLEELSSEGSGLYRVFYFFRDPASQAQIDRDFEKATFGKTEPFKIPDGQYYVMGDNRDFSYDSRFYGTVPRELIWGTATLIYWSSYSGQSHDEKIRWERINKLVN